MASWEKHLPLTSCGRAASLLTKLGIYQQMLESGARELACQIDRILKASFESKTTMLPRDRVMVFSAQQTSTKEMSLHTSHCSDDVSTRPFCAGKPQQKREGKFNNPNFERDSNNTEAGSRPKSTQIAEKIRSQDISVSQSPNLDMNPHHITVANSPTKWLQSSNVACFSNLKQMLLEFCMSPSSGSE